MSVYKKANNECDSLLAGIIDNDPMKFGNEGLFSAAIEAIEDLLVKLLQKGKRVYNLLFDVEARQMVELEKMLENAKEADDFTMDFDTQEHSKLKDSMSNAGYSSTDLSTLGGATIVSCKMNHKEGLTTEYKKIVKDIKDGKYKSTTYRRLVDAYASYGTLNGGTATSSLFRNAVDSAGDKNVIAYTFITGPINSTFTAVTYKKSNSNTVGDAYVVSFTGKRTDRHILQGVYTKKMHIANIEKVMSALSDYSPREMMKHYNKEMGLLESEIANGKEVKGDKKQKRVKSHIKYLKQSTLLGAKYTKENIEFATRILKMVEKEI